MRLGKQLVVVAVAALIGSRAEPAANGRAPLAQVAGAAEGEVAGMAYARTGHRDPGGLLHGLLSGSTATLVA